MHPSLSISLNTLNTLNALYSHPSLYISLNTLNAINALVHVPNFEGVSGSADKGGGDNSIQFINIVRVGGKSFKERRQKLGGRKGG